MPNVRVDVEAAAAVAPEGDEPLRRHVVAGQRQGNDEGLPLQGIEQLPAIGVIVGPPDERAFAGRGAIAGGGFLWSPELLSIGRVPWEGQRTISMGKVFGSSTRDPQPSRLRSLAMTSGVS